MNNRTILICCVVFSFALAIAARETHAASLPIDLEVGIEPGTSLTAPQEWNRILGKMNLASVRVRSVRPTDQPSIKPNQVATGTRYQVTALLNSRDQLVFPNHKFSSRDQRKLREFLEQLPVKTEHSAQPRGRFDLTEQQFRKIHASLSIPVTFSTEGLTAKEMLAQLNSTIAIPIAANPRVKSRLLHPLKSELQGICSGTALALALRQQGLILIPAQPPGGQLHFQIDDFDPQVDYWPAGWKPEGSLRRAAPSAYEKLELEVSNYTFQKAITALQPRLQMPILIDHWILNTKKISLEVPVKMARKKTFLKGALDRLASQARVATEIRVDEQGQPFLWITQFGKQSPTASR